MTALDSNVQSTVDLIVTAAREAALRAEEIETVAARRAHALRTAADAEAERVRMEAREAAEQYLQASRRLVDEFARERLDRIAALSDRLLAAGEALVERMESAQAAERRLGELRGALVAAAEAIAAEAAAPPPALSGGGVVVQLVERAP